MEAAVRSRVLIDVILPEVRAGSRTTRVAVDAALIVGFALLVALCAQISIKFPTTIVPITGQTFGVLLTGGALGSWRGGMSMLLYMFMGMASIPLFAPSSGFLAEETFHIVLPWSGSDGAGVEHGQWRVHRRVRCSVVRSRPAVRTRLGSQVHRTPCDVAG